MVQMGTEVQNQKMKSHHIKGKVKLMIVKQRKTKRIVRISLNQSQRYLSLLLRISLMRKKIRKTKRQVLRNQKKNHLSLKKKKNLYNVKVLIKRSSKDQMDVYQFYVIMNLQRLRVMHIIYIRSYHYLENIYDLILIIIKI